MKHLILKLPKGRKNEKEKFAAYKYGGACVASQCWTCTDKCGGCTATCGGCSDFCGGSCTGSLKI